MKVVIRFELILQRFMRDVHENVVKVHVLFPVNSMKASEGVWVLKDLGN